MPPKRASTTEAPAMTQDAIRKLVADSVTSALVRLKLRLSSASNPNRETQFILELCSENGKLQESLVVNLFFNSCEGAIGLISMVERNRIVFLVADGKVKQSNFATSTLTGDALLDEIRKMEEELYNLDCIGKMILNLMLDRFPRINGSMSKSCIKRQQKKVDDIRNFLQQIPAAIICNTNNRYDNVVNITEVQEAVEPMLLLHQKTVEWAIYARNAKAEPATGVINSSDSDCGEESRQKCTRRHSCGQRIPDVFPEDLPADKELESPIHPHEVRQFLGLATITEIYRWFFKVAKPLTNYQRTSIMLERRTKNQLVNSLNKKLCEAPILALPEGNDNFVVYCDASLQGLGAVLMQREKVIAYASRQIKPSEEKL
ncbi:putative reverse transcriptase domain-containing protein [Tanacetum coccineum]